MSNVEAVVWDCRNARDRTSMGLLLEPVGGMSTDGGLLRGHVPKSVTNYYLHHEPGGGNGIVGGMLAAPPPAYVVGLIAPALMLIPATQ
jgi:hypothetical protein